MYRSGGRFAALVVLLGCSEAPEVVYGPACARGQACSGYTLIGSPENDSGAEGAALLVDMQGNEVHRWGITGFPAKMLPGGSLIGCEGVVAGSYGSVRVLQLSWDGTQEWSFSDWVRTDMGSVARQHHDVQREGNPVGAYAPGQPFVDNGRTLVLAHLRRSVPAIRAGDIDDDVMYVVDASGALTEFRWFAGDHFEEFGFDDAARRDLAARSDSVLEWLHGNSMSRLGSNHWFDEGHDEFHPDNIIYSSREANFVAIISHATGAVVWRIGPDFAGRPEEGLGQFAGQHHAHMIPRGLPGAGNILVFDNGGASGYGGDEVGYQPFRYKRDWSRVLEFDPVTLEIVWQYGSASGGQHFYSGLLSSAQRLPNGNTLITIGVPGALVEVTPDQRVVWQYQYEGGVGRAGWVYRGYRIPPEWLPEGENQRHGDYASWADQFE